MVRYKNRYILLELLPENYSRALKPLDIKQNVIYKVVVNTLKRLYGDYGYGFCKEGLIVKYSNKKLGITMIRVRHDAHQLILSILPHIKTIQNKVISLKCLYVGATVKCCFKYLKKYQEQRLIEDLKIIEGKSNFKALCKELLNRTHPTTVL